MSAVLLQTAIQGVRAFVLRSSAVPFFVAAAAPDILALKHVSRIFGHHNNPALLVSHFQASI